MLLIEKFFALNGLPWDIMKAKAVDEFGAQCLEHLKIRRSRKTFAKSLWTHCGYKTKSEAGTGSEIVRYTSEETSLMIPKIVGHDAVIRIDDAEISEPTDPSEFEQYGDKDGVK